ncbi:peptidoglycan/xylan/chitin deacetylase (PgdA/CDA1 family) [Chitinophaga skermanii]|uniref:Peptidoglycan/xylan/chitin deacetylase (PgdA/CDA1 family) n=1 Tax=Chitinophaga skermanii TaxID=331697 RepID=A0A327QD71_9BACT|nr:polysaccharide deacetylase family protein [Chitinophaga skermanii]RAJ02606.1 peptidoglycan/xylan/chitin deacetylase (PgdA/CDA1 family) [Chitinophaga skermanii]
MLNFRNVNIIFVLLVIALITVHRVFVPISLWVYVVTVWIYCSILAYGAYFIKAGFFIKSHCKGHPNRKEVALSFDDGPLEDFTPEVLKILREHDVQAAFFCIGNRIEGREDILKSMHADGHIIGNHSFHHGPYIDLYSSKRILQELQDTDNAIHKVIGEKPRMFRPPYGVTNPNMRNAIVNGGYASIGWSVRSYDTVAKDADKLLEKVTKHVKNGDVFLFHDTCAVTVQLLPYLIQRLRNQGFTIVRLDEILNIPAYA